MPGAARDDLATLGAIGALAYVCETLVHEAVGHGMACLARGGTILQIAPLWMRCSEVSWSIVAAGPLANVLAGALCSWALRASRPSAPPLRLWLWWSVAFQWLVAAGYLVVGGATGFGDWSALLSPLLPGWVWRAGAVLVGGLLFATVLRRVSGRLDPALGLAGGGPARVRRLVGIPASAAAVVAVLAELLGPGATPVGILLALGCTGGVGLSLLASADPATAVHPVLTVQRSGRWIVAGALAALVLLGVAVSGSLFPWAARRS